MEGVNVKHLDELPTSGQGVFTPVRDALGVTSFGVNVERWPGPTEQYPEHDESFSGQEELYFCLRGSAVLQAGGADHELVPGTFVRVSPGVSRKLSPGPDGVDLFCVGGIPGQPYEPPDRGPGRRASA